MGAQLTDTTQEAEWPPQEAVMVAVPEAMAVTLPLPSTLATPGLEELQRTVRSVALEGETLALSRATSPTPSSRLLLDRDTELTSTRLGVGAGVGCGLGVGLGVA